MWRRNLHQIHGYFNPAFKSAGDYDFWLRVAGERNFFHLPLMLGLYHANEHGIELGNPELSERESLQAQLNNAVQSGVDIDPMGKMIRVRINGGYTFVDRDAYMDQAEWVKYKR
jgi:hypothetical protein